MKRECPICQRRSARSERCSCGYEYATGDVRSVVLRARHDNERAGRWVTRGVAVLAVVPFLIFMALPFFGAAHAFWYVLPVIAAGATSAIAGIVRRRGAHRLLGRAQGPLTLPPARIV